MSIVIVKYDCQVRFDSVVPRDTESRSALPLAVSHCQVEGVRIFVVVVRVSLLRLSVTLGGR